MSLLSTEVNNKPEEDYDDLFVRQISFYGKEIDFFFIEATMNKTDDPSPGEYEKMDHALIILNPEKF
ncbi:MAG TPA: hypothetical protein VK207_11705 [Bacteroidales bacterium]|jgi:hypothetical protein|nr:hypothetical protein [Bacteroidales bacterium]